MIQSMTGFGKSVLQLPTKKITIEIKSLNGKNLDITIRIPPCYKEKELEVRKKIAENLVRGKVECSFYIEAGEEDVSSTINNTMVANYINQMKELYDDGTEMDYLRMAIGLPDSIKTERAELDESEWLQVDTAIKAAIDQIQTYRSDEGMALEEDLRLRIKNITALLEQITLLEPDRMVLVKEKLKKTLAELHMEIDQNRFEQELIYYLEKLDITEEKIRLSNHLNYFLKELSAEKSNGKKLGFIAQEMGREINTIGSKSNHAPMQRMVVQMKDELEKIKEQILNVL